MRRGGLAFITLCAFGLRIHALGDVPLRWDEGWSIALAKLPVREMLGLTALDVHPPLYYLALAMWLPLGNAHEFYVRALSVLAATTAAPLGAVAAVAWTARPGRGDERAGLLAAAYVAVAPALVYYGGVARMYAFTTPALLLAAYGLGRMAGSRRDAGGPRVAAWVAAALGSLAALYTFYYAGLALAGLFAAALLAGRRARRHVLALATVVALGFLPWVAVATGPLLQRVGAQTGGRLALEPLPSLVRDGLCGALLCESGGSPALWTPVIILIVGAVALRPRRRALRYAAVTGLPVAAVLLGAAVGAQAHMFAARYAIVATPFLAMGIGWALAAMWNRAPLLGAGAALAALIVIAPSLTSYVYEKTAEVTEPYDPASVWRALTAKADRDDIVAFNILSLAGAYERYRTDDDPAWTYAQAWDPVHEPLDQALRRLETAAAEHSRLWLVLYKGVVSEDSAAIKAWADRSLYPAAGWWQGDTWFLGYVLAPTGQHVAPRARFGTSVELASASFTSVSKPAGGIAVRLVWRALEVPSADARVFVHAYDPEGRLVAQHDGAPVAESRPLTSWRRGERVFDRHGPWVPRDARGPLELVVGLYDPLTGDRWTTDLGSDSVTLGRVRLAP